MRDSHLKPDYEESELRDVFERPQHKSIVRRVQGGQSINSPLIWETTQLPIPRLLFTQHQEPPGNPKPQPTEQQASKKKKKKKKKKQLIGSKETQVNDNMKRTTQPKTRKIQIPKQP